MLLASRMDSNFSSWEVRSVARNEDASIVFVRGCREKSLAVLTFEPYLLGLRTGMVMRRKRQVVVFIASLVWGFLFLSFTRLD